eukprot:m.38667 g.38667  ORF g.38667 m.38667 type:complete len:53 (+) comp32622_c0_seq4:95-253(+)
MQHIYSQLLPAKFKRVYKGAKYNQKLSLLTVKTHLFFHSNSVACNIDRSNSA